MYRPKVVLALSGGLDSSTLLAQLLHLHLDVIPVVFLYGSKHNQYEIQAAIQIAAFYSKMAITIDVLSLFRLLKSDLLLSGGEIPEGHYEAASMKQTVVPSRNLIFASILTGYAQSVEADCIALGVHQGDHAIYPDCRPSFIESLTETVDRSTEGKVSVLAPFLHYTKAAIVKIGLKLEVPYGITRTCYKQQTVACGRCGSCIERLEAFALNGAQDPLCYEEPPHGES